MGSSSSKLENPNLFSCTFKKIYGNPSVIGIDDKLDWKITRISLYQVPINTLAHITKTAHYYLIFDVCSNDNDNQGFILSHFTVDGTKHLEFHKSKSQAIFTSFEQIYLTSKVELLRFWDTNEKFVRNLKESFDEWNKPFNLVLSNCRKFTRFIVKRLGLL